MKNNRRNRQNRNGEPSVSADELLQTLKKTLSEKDVSEESVQSENHEFDPSDFFTTESDSVKDSSEQTAEKELDSDALLHRFMAKQERETEQNMSNPTEADMDRIMASTANLPVIDLDFDETEMTEDESAHDAFDEHFEAFDETVVPAKKPGFFARLFSKMKSNREEASAEPESDEQSENGEAAPTEEDGFDNGFDPVEAQAELDADVDSAENDVAVKETESDDLISMEETREIFAARSVMKDDPKGGEETTSPSEFDETDAKLMVAFGMEDQLAQTIGMEKATELGDSMERSSDEHQPRKKKEKQPKATEAEKKEVLEEYTEPSQTKQVFAIYRNRFYSVLLRMAACLLLLLFTFLFETFSIFGDALNRNIYPSVYILADLQILVFGGALIYRQLLSGYKALISFRPSPDSLSVLLLGGTVIYHLIALICGNTSVRMFNLTVLAFIMMNLVYEYMNTKRQLFTLNVIASKHPKFAVKRADSEDSELETEGFSEFLPKDPVIFQVRKTEFVDNFFAKNAERSRYSRILGVVIPATLIAAVLFFVVGLIVTKSFFAGVCAAYLTTLFILPSSAFLCWAFPMYQAAKEAYAVKSALVGENAAFSCSGASAISFEDKEVFPTYGVRVNSVKVYGDHRIDRVLSDVSGIFSVIGGPLAAVLANATKDLGVSENVTIEEIRSNGLIATVDGKQLTVGKAAFLYDLGIAPVVDSDDENAENDPETSVMYLTENGEVAAKLYVKYVMDPDFEFVVKQMYRIGVCVGIKTFDPNIDDEMIGANIRTSKYPVRILKCHTADHASQTEDHMDSGIVSRRGAKALLQTMTLCDRITNAVKTNIVVKIVSMAIAIIIMGCILFLGNVSDVPSVYVMLYQIFWLIPVYCISKVLVGRL